MDCTGVALHLVAYQLGTVTDDERDLVEAHLLECGPCLRTYLALKRSADRAERDRPSAEARARLRAAVAKEFGTETKRTFFAYRVPLYQSVALAAIAAALALAVPSVLSRVSSHEARAGEPVDTARTRAESFHIY